MLWMTAPSACRCSPEASTFTETSVSWSLQLRPQHRGQRLAGSDPAQAMGQTGCPQDTPSVTRTSLPAEHVLSTDFCLSDLGPVMSRQARGKHVCQKQSLCLAELTNQKEMELFPSLVALLVSLQLSLPLAVRAMYCIAVYWNFRKTATPMSVAQCSDGFCSGAQKPHPKGLPSAEWDGGCRPVCFVQVPHPSRRCMVSVALMGSPETLIQVPAVAPRPSTWGARSTPWLQGIYNS